ncbi:hypothetical protein HPYSS1_04768, partial [Helicobacter pylori SS1]
KRNPLKREFKNKGFKKIKPPKKKEFKRNPLKKRVSQKVLTL